MVLRRTIFSKLKTRKLICKKKDSYIASKQLQDYLDDYLDDEPSQDFSGQETKTQEQEDLELAKALSLIEDDDNEQENYKEKKLPSKKKRKSETEGNIQNKKTNSSSSSSSSSISSSSSSNGSNSSRTNSECTICLQDMGPHNQRMTVIPCGHSCVCLPCEKTFYKKIHSLKHCPACGQSIDNWIKTFL